MSNTHIPTEVTYTDVNGVEQTITMYEATRGTRGGARGLRWYTCAQCRYDFPEDQIVLINGTPYCIVNSCAEDHEE